jgi:hypothetical protein
MKLANNKIGNIATVILLVFAVSSTLALIPAVSAHDPPVDIPTWAYISASPSTVGTGQSITIVMWLNDYPITE